MTQTGDELHHFGWNACSSCLCHIESNGHAGHDHGSAERRYLVVPGLRSSRIYIIDTKPDPRHPTIVKTIEPDELAARTGYSRPHTSHCGPDGIYMSALGAADLPASVWTWYRDNDGQGKAVKTIEIPAEPAAAEQLPPALQPFGAVPPLVTDIDLSVDDRFLYVSCWGTGEFRQYDVSDPFNPRLTGSVHMGGIVRRAAHPKQPKAPLNGGPQMVEVSRDGRRVYFTNSLYSPWDEQFYPDGVRSWMVKLNAMPQGGLEVDP